MKHISIILLMIIILSTVQVAESKNDTLYQTLYTVKDGLCYNAVRDIVEDKNGGLWIATDDNVSYFKNNQWKTYTQKDGLSCSQILSLKIDQSGVIWFATAIRGVCSFDGKNWTKYDTSKGLLSMECFDLTVDKKNNIWVTHPTDGASMFDGKKWITFTEDEMCKNWTRQVVMDSKGTVWIAHPGGGLSAFDGKSWSLHYEGLVRKSETAYIDRYDTLWFGSDYGSYKYYNNNATLFLDTSNGLPGDNNMVGFIYKDSKNRVWMQIVNFGLVMVEGEKVTVFDSTNSVMHNNPQAAFEDSQGNIWVASLGLVCFSETTPIDKPFIKHVVSNKSFKCSFTQNKIMLSFDSKISQKARMFCYKLNGACVIDRSISFSKGINTFTIPKYQFSHGNYIFLIHTDEGNKFAKKILIN